MTTRSQKDSSAEGSTCEQCHQELCEHGECECGQETCRACYRKRQDELDADREAWFQHNVVGPLLGFDKELP